MISLLVLLAVLAQAPTSMAQPAVTPNPSAGPSYVPQRVYDTRANTFTDFEAMVADLARADVVLVGEQHDDPNTHRLELAMLDGLLRRKVPVTVSLEMFERDAQAPLDAYLAGTMSEDEFLKGARPWPRYATDYRPLVEMAKAQRWSVLASNVPRRIASEVSKGGQAALDAKTGSERALFARELQCPRDAYFERFATQMSSHPMPGQEEKAAAETTERYYWSQCLKDETMAESIAAAFRAQPRRAGTIVHYNGSFHSDFRHGVAQRVIRRLPGRRVAVVSILPAADLDTAAPAEDDVKRADYLIYTIK
jgi:uncharacterized iron-regulated protein